MISQALASYCYSFQVTISFIKIHMISQEFENKRATICPMPPFLLLPRFWPGTRQMPAASS
jgi:hypothetical protein